QSFISILVFFLLLAISVARNGSADPQSQHEFPPSIDHLTVGQHKSRSGSLASAAGDAHVPADAWPVVAAVDDEIVALRLGADRAIDRLADQRVVGRGAQGSPQVRCVLLAETGVDRAGASNPH